MQISPIAMGQFGMLNVFFSILYSRYIRKSVQIRSVFFLALLSPLKIDGCMEIGSNISYLSFLTKLLTMKETMHV